MINFETDNLITALKVSHKKICLIQQRTETNKTSRNRKQKVRCNFKVETADLLDVVELAAWISKAYRFELDEEKENEKLNVVTQAAIQSAKRDTYIDCWDDLLTGNLSIEVKQKLEIEKRKQRFKKMVGSVGIS